MNELSALSAQQLRRAAEIKDRIEALQVELSRTLGTSVPVAAKGSPAKPVPGVKRGPSPAARAKMAAAARAWWAAKRKGSGGAAKTAGKSGAGGRPKMSAAARARIAAKLRARWAAAKAAGRSAL